MSTEKMEFQTEVKQLLDIVINSLYTDKEIFLRELISNAADALEKMRYLSVTEHNIYQPELELQIQIKVDPEQQTILIEDTGVGMSKTELIENLGTIAHSGSKAFLQSLQQENPDFSLIGQFGVGFYAAFMVAQEVVVSTRSYRPEESGWQWISDGTGSFEIEPLANAQRGTSILLKLKESEFASKDRLLEIGRKYSSFVPFPVLLEGEKLNTLQAIWALNKNEISEEEYKEFYKYIANAFDEPSYRLHFTADAPLSIKALIYVPGENMEKFGFGKLEPGINLYCRKVLIQQHCEFLLPEWLRFLKGVVDSEEIPLNISRETMQDSSLMAKLKKVITNRFLKFLNEQAKKEPEKYAAFWSKFGGFLKAGAATDHSYQKELAPLLRFESSNSESGRYVSLSEYVGRMPENQKNIYFINGANRETIEAGPYLEAFKQRNLEVIYTLEPLDDFVLSNLAEFEEKKLVSADSADLDLPEMENEIAADKLEELPLNSLLEWLKTVLESKVSEVKASDRLVDSPAILINMDNYLTSSMQKYLQEVQDTPMGIFRKTLEINPAHALIKGLAVLRAKDEDFAKLIAEQLYDNALIASGLPADPKTMVARTYQILTRAVQE